jgi:putative IMPACT (imprinted ancient) family translation regulator
LALDLGPLVKKEIKLPFRLEFEYSQMDKVMRLLKEKQIEIVSQQMDMRVQLALLVSKSKQSVFRESLAQMHEVKVEGPEALN